MKAFNFLWCLLLAACNPSTQYPVISAAEANVDTKSYTQPITIDLTTAHENQRFSVRGRQVYYDLGIEPSKAGAISVRINTTQGPAITLVPGGQINFDGVMDVFVSNTAQPGKIATLMVNTDATISNNPTSPLSSGQNKTLPFLSATYNSISNNHLAGAAPVNVELVPDSANGSIIHLLSISVAFQDYRDVMCLAAITTVAPFFKRYQCTKTGNLVIENFFLQPGSNMLREITSSPLFGNASEYITVLYTPL